MNWRISMLLVTVSFFLSNLNSEAGVYKWVDKNGKIHFTDSRANIPEDAKVRIQRELGSATQKKQLNQSEVRSLDSNLEDGKSQKSGLDMKELNLDKLNNRQKDILDKLDREILDLRGELLESENQYNDLKKQSIETSQEAFYDMDYSDQHRAERHELQRKAYRLDQEHVEAGSIYFKIKEKLKLREYQRQEFLNSSGK